MLLPSTMSTGSSTTRRRSTPASSTAWSCSSRNLLTRSDQLTWQCPFNYWNFHSQCEMSLFLIIQFSLYLCRNCVSIYCTTKWRTKKRIMGLNSMKNFPQSGKPYWDKFRLLNTPPEILSVQFFLTTKKWIFFLEKCLDKVLWHSDGCILFWFWFYYYFTGCERTEGFFISMFAATVTEVSSCSKSTDLKWIKKQKKRRTFTEYFIRYSIANTAQMKLDGMIWASMYCHMHNNI